MTLLNYVNQVAQRAGEEITKGLNLNESLKDYLIGIFNLVHKDFNNRYPWPWRHKTTTLQVVANYKTGTVTVTNGSRTVSGTGGATFTSAMIGRLFKLDRDVEMYQIKAVPTSSSLTLEQPYIGDSGSSLTYFIWKKYYSLPSDVQYGSNIYVNGYPYKLGVTPKEDFDNSFISPFVSGLPLAWTWYGIDRTVSTYTTGSVSGTVDTKTLTGSGTTFIDNVFEGTKVTIGTLVYNVESVDSNTQLTLVQNLKVAVASGTTYSAETKNRSLISLSSTPDPVINLSLVYSKNTYDYLNDNDEPEIWSGYEHIMVDGMYAYLLEKKTSEKALPYRTVYEAEIKAAWGTILNKNGPKKASIYSQSTANYRHSLD